MSRSWQENCKAYKKKKKKGKYDSLQGKKIDWTHYEEAQMLNLVDKDFKFIILNMLKELKKTMDKELKEIRKTMYEQVRIINK